MRSFLLIPLLIGIALFSLLRAAPLNRCGKEFDNAVCPLNRCCSSSGWCGQTEAHCGEGCQSNCHAPLYLSECVMPNQVALTFDDGPNENWPQLLAILKEMKQLVTFFVLGVNIKGNEEFVDQAAWDGHTIAVHSWSHPDLTTVSNSTIKTEIETTIAAITEITGETPVYFRPPYLAYDERVHGVVQSFGLTTVWTNLDTKDYLHAEENPEMIVKKVKNILAKKKASSYISLQHEMYIQSVEKVKEIIELIEGEGYTIVTMDDCLNP